MRITDFIKGPVRYEDMGTMIMDADNNLVCDIRGWGRFQRMPNGMDIQDFIGRTIALAINDSIDKSIEDAPPLAVAKE